MSSPRFEILAYEDTPLGLLCLRRRELLSRPGTVVTEVSLNHELLMSSYITDSERALARLALDMHHGGELDVLVGGLGLGYTAHELLTVGSDRIARVEVLEYLPQVIDWVERGLVPLADDLRAEPRLTATQGDVYGRLAGPPERQHDLILIDVDHSPDEHLGGGSHSFYTKPGLGRVREHLREDGILAVWSYARHSPFATALQEVFSEVRVEPVTTHNDLVDAEHTDWLFLARA